MLRIPDRARHVTQEPHLIAPGLLGAPLGSFRRRLAAFVLDVVVFSLAAGLVFTALTVLSFHRQDPTFIPRLRQVGALPDSVRVAERRDLFVSFARMLAARRPEALPADMLQMMASGDMTGLERVYGTGAGVVTLTGGASTFKRTDDAWTLAVGPDLLLGDFATFFSWGAAFTAWFTVWTRAGQGRTLGKRLCGLRVARLDGRPLGWWDAFGRAGGYSASTATALLGFFEAAWHPNRQALHDRIAGTVVLRTFRGSPRS